MTTVEIDVEANDGDGNCPSFEQKWCSINSRKSTQSKSSFCSSGSQASVFSTDSLERLISRVPCLGTQTRIKDESGVFPVCLIIVSILVAVSCSIAAFILHLSVQGIGCLSGLNGCHEHVLLDRLKPLGIPKSVYFIVSSGFSGLVCSLILYSPFQGGIARRCKGGGAADTKVVISSGATVNGWVVVLRILLATLYMGGGNPLGTEGPIIHASSSLAIWLVSKSGKKRRKLLSTFGVIGAAAGISAGFNVHVTGFVYVIEELTRTLSAKLALVLAFAAGTAHLVKDVLEELMHQVLHLEHTSLVPEHSTWANLTAADWKLSLLLCLPIGVLTGIAGWVFTDCAWALMKFLNPEMVGEKPSRCRRVFLPEWSHLAIVGIICGCLGAIAYEVTGMNGVWGTTGGAVKEAMEKGLRWEHLLLLFATKFLAFVLATAAAGPGGLLIPSLVTGGFLGLTVAQLLEVNGNVCAACAVIGMGSMFASVMHMPVTGVIIIFELTRADNLSLHIAIANFIATNVVYRLPHGTHSFVHRTLALNPTWGKLDQRDFIETDAQEMEADVALFKSTIGLWLLTDSERMRSGFDAWREAVQHRTSSKSPRTRLAQQRQLLEQECHSGRSATSDASFEAELDAKRRRDLRNLWESVSSVLPGLNWRLWKSLNTDQRTALAEAASRVAHEPPTPKLPIDRQAFKSPHTSPGALTPQGDQSDDDLLDWPISTGSALGRTAPHCLATLPRTKQKSPDRSTSSPQSPVLSTVTEYSCGFYLR